MTADILASARGQLAVVGPAALSLRAVARDIGVVSSAVYRYVASRDDLITALLVQCYGELGRAAEETDVVARGLDAAEGVVPRRRWRTACATVRQWALDHPHEYALLYGSPVPGYRAPADTVPAASRVTRVLVGAVVTGWLAGDEKPATPAGMDANRGTPAAEAGPPDADGADSADVDDSDSTDAVGVESTEAVGVESTDAVGTGLTDAVREFLLEEAEGRSLRLDERRIEQAVIAWSSVFGLVSFELFGHFVGSVIDAPAFFGAAVERIADDLDLAPDGP